MKTTLKRTAGAILDSAGDGLDGVDEAGLGVVLVVNLPVSALANVQCRPAPTRLAQLREDWDDFLVRPIRLRMGADGFRVLDGNHRITLVREFGRATIRAEVQLSQ